MSIKMKLKKLHGASSSELKWLLPIGLCIVFGKNHNQNFQFNVMSCNSTGSNTHLSGVI